MNENLARLQREWWFVLAAGAAALAAGFVLLQGAWNGAERLRWAGLAGAIVAYQALHLRRCLATNHPAGQPGALYAQLGLANWITLVRALFLALLVGFLLLPWPGGAAAWAPGILYLSAALLDFLDGWAARATHRASVLGETLDMHWDGFGVLVASALLVQYGQAPWWYLLVGLARYLFLAGMWLRARRGLANHPLPPSHARRGLAGVQMGYIAVALLPIFTPPATRIAASLFMLPLLIGFLRDWLVVSGTVQPGARGLDAWGRQARLHAWLPLALRALAVGLLAAALLVELAGQHPRLLLVVALGAGMTLIGAGALGRAAGLGVVLVSGFVLREAPTAWVYWAILFTGAALMLFGTGSHSLWKPEEWLIYHRAGEARPQR